jgi:hypothetical protein
MVALGGAQMAAGGAAQMVVEEVAQLAVGGAAQMAAEGNYGRNLDGNDQVHHCYLGYGPYECAVTQVSQIYNKYDVIHTSGLAARVRFLGGE